MLTYSEKLHTGNEHNAVWPKKHPTVQPACNLISISTFSIVHEYCSNTMQTGVMTTPYSSFHAYYEHSA